MPKNWGGTMFVSIYRNINVFKIVMFTKFQVHTGNVIVH